MYNLTLPITAETDSKVVDELEALPFPPSYTHQCRAE